MIVHWAMQYGCSVEILNEDIREEIRKELKEMSKLYGNR
ncbi:MAG: WYL domain-containing protein [Lachnospiraceae bacterium]|nr:WYL domain-containing protein [Lachnospiraceae bacterium]